MYKNYSKIYPKENAFQVRYYQFDQDDNEFRLYWFENFSTEEEAQKHHIKMMEIFNAS